MTMTPIPHATRLDHTAAFLSQGYRFISSRCQRYESDLFATRLFLRPVVCMMGAEAAEVMYVPDRFTRRGGLPVTTLMLLQDKDSVATLDGEAHRWRKQMFMSLMTPDRIHQLADQFASEWRHQAGTWTRKKDVVLHDEVEEMLCRAVCAWAGVPLAEEEVAQRTREFEAMIHGSGTVGLRTMRGLLLRQRTERWCRDLVERVRAGRLEVPEESALHLVAWHRDPNGNLLDTGVAAVEVINVLRPTVAVARYVTFAAVALHEHPEWRQILQDGGDEEVELFVQEVRRFYPFFPLVGGRVRQAFDWRDHHFDEGSWVLLDLYGTNHDPRSWDQPDAFRPERFREWDGSPYTFIPQGGGDHATNHRCPGEWITIALVKEAVRLLATEMRYDVPEQDLEIDLGHMPALPNSRFIIRDVQMDATG